MDSLTSSAVSAADRRRAHTRVGVVAVVAFVALLLLGAARSAGADPAQQPAPQRTTPNDPSSGQHDGGGFGRGEDNSGGVPDFGGGDESGGAGSDPGFGGGDDPGLGGGDDPRLGGGDDPGLGGGDDPGLGGGDDPSGVPDFGGASGGRTT